MTKHGILPI